MLSSEEILARAARDGHIDSARWPEVLKAVLEKLDHNVFNEFALPAELSSENARTSPAILPQAFPSQSSSTPLNRQDPQPPSSPPEPASGSSASLDVTNQTLPKALSTALAFVKKSLTQNFAQHPPHTIQRLSELLIHPKEHYKYLHAYLNALDRVIAVSSGANIFPLPAIEGSSTSGTSSTLINGSSASRTNLHGDESLGGALLTPISWLKERRTPSDDTPSPTTPESRELGSNLKDELDVQMDEEKGITQGELLRQEQEASDPPEPVTSISSTTDVAAKSRSESIHGLMLSDATDTIADGVSLEGKQMEGVYETDQLHARGPEQIGMADTGPQEHVLGYGQVLDMEAAAGRNVHPRLASLSPEIKMQHMDDNETRNVVGAAVDHNDPEENVLLEHGKGLAEHDQEIQDSNSESEGSNLADARRST